MRGRFRNYLFIGDNMRTINAAVRVATATAGYIFAELYFEAQDYHNKPITYQAYCSDEGHNEATRFYIKYEMRNPRTVTEHVVAARLVTEYERKYNCNINIIPWYKLKVKRAEVGK